MFDFMDSDGFIIGVEILFLCFIGYDAWKYYLTRRKEYLLNIALAIGFAIWVLYPFYKKYYEWEEVERESVISACLREHNQSYCACVDNAIFKTYTKSEYQSLDKTNNETLNALVKESLEECFDD